MKLRTSLFGSSFLVLAMAGANSVEAQTAPASPSSASTPADPTKAADPAPQTVAPSEPASAAQSVAAAPASSINNGPDTNAQQSDIVVTGTRAVTNGYSAPTPVTVQTATQLRASQPSVIEGLRDVPQLSASSSPRTPSRITAAGNTTVGGANLRNLGPGRTLVLLDGRRGPPSSSSGVVDINLIPDLLVKRVDVVTGGASAAYGSDAVAGVVNFVFDTDFTGVRSILTKGVTSYGDGSDYTARLAVGTKFAGDRGHIVFSVDLFGQEGIDGQARNWSKDAWLRIANPNAALPGQPQFLLREGVRVSNASYGGLITGPTPLRGTAFDANGNPYQFNFGSLNNGSFSVGGDGTFYPFPISSDAQSQTFFTHAKYDLTDHLNVFVEGLYGHSDTSYGLIESTVFGTTPFTIFSDNAFLPTSIKTQMQTAGITSFTLGKVARSEGLVINRNINDTISATGGFNAKLGGGWLLDGYYEYGRNKLVYGNDNISKRTAIYAAADAVVNPTNGQIVCRITLTSPTASAAQGCVPINPFGEAPLNDAQRAYLKGQQRVYSIAEQQSAAITLRGTPFSTWAGPVNIAVGGEYRKESVGVTVDPLSSTITDGTGIRGFPTSAQGQLLSYNITNIPQPTAGSFDVKEAFGEILVPLAKQISWAYGLDFNGAIRYTNYSTSGGVVTYKIGLTYAPIQAIRFRGTKSRDIRAPNIAELFGVSSTNLSTLIDPQKNNTAISGVRTVSGANPLLTPEIADTYTGGVVLRAGGFGASVDYYNIKINQAISSLTGQQIINQCAAGQTSLCGLVQRDTGGNLTLVNAILLNVQSVEASGFDFEGSWAGTVGPGRVSIRGAGTYVGHYKLISVVGDPIEQAGAGSANPRVIASLSANYKQGGFSIDAQERFISAQKRVLLPTTIDDNHIPATFYTNLRVGYSFENARGKPELFLSVNNLFDQDPRITDTNGGGAGLFAVTNTSLYDAIGRYLQIGVQARF